MARVVVHVMPKAEILDPQGQAIVGALGRLGHPGISEVRQGKRFELEVDDTVDDSTLAEIAEAAGLPARTVRFYISRGLLNGPVKGGRVAAYTAEHVGRLEQIKHLQAKGHTLSAIGRILGGPSAEEPEAMPAKSFPVWQKGTAQSMQRPPCSRRVCSSSGTCITSQSRARSSGEPKTM